MERNDLYTSTTPPPPEYQLAAEVSAALGFNIDAMIINLSKCTHNKHLVQTEEGKHTQYLANHFMKNYTPPKLKADINAAYSKPKLQE